MKHTRHEMLCSLAVKQLHIIRNKWKFVTWVSGIHWTVCLSIDSRKLGDTTNSWLCSPVIKHSRHVLLCVPPPISSPNTFQKHAGKWLKKEQRHVQGVSPVLQASLVTQSLRHRGKFWKIKEQVNGEEKNSFSTSKDCILHNVNYYFVNWFPLEQELNVWCSQSAQNFQSLSFRFCILHQYWLTHTHTHTRYVYSINISCTSHSSHFI